MLDGKRRGDAMEEGGFLSVCGEKKLIKAASAAYLVSSSFHRPTPALAPLKNGNCVCPDANERRGNTALGCLSLSLSLSPFKTRSRSNTAWLIMEKTSRLFAPPYLRWTLTRRRREDFRWMGLRTKNIFRRMKLFGLLLWYTWRIIKREASIGRFYRENCLAFFLLQILSSNLKFFLNFQYFIFKKLWALISSKFSYEFFKINFSLFPFICFEFRNIWILKFEEILTFWITNLYR